jgi:hypothetical protein
MSFKNVLKNSTVYRFDFRQHSFYGIVFVRLLKIYILFGACVCMRVIVVIYCQASSESATMKSEGHQ